MRSAVPLALLLGLFAGAFLGGWLQGRSAEGADRDRSSDVRTEEPVAPRAAVSLEPAAPRAPFASSGAGASERQDVASDEPVFTAALAEYGRAGLERGWNSVRADELPAGDLEEGLAAYEQTVLEAPELIGSRLAERADARDEAARVAREGSGLELLAQLEAGAQLPLPELVRDDERFAEFFRSRHGSATMDATELERTDYRDLPSGTILNFPPGVHELMDLRSLKPFPADLTIAGAGLGATLLILRGSVGVTEPVERLTLRDCTLYTAGRRLFDMRGDAAIVALDRVRVLGFDSSAGSDLLYFDEGGLLTARDSSFLGGYGSAPGAGSLFARHSLGLARFLNCEVVGMGLGLERLEPEFAVLFRGCNLASVTGSTLLEAQELGIVQLQNTSIDLFAGEPGTYPKQDLNALFPGWVNFR